MVAHLGTHVGSVKISEAVGRLKTVRPDGSLARTARALALAVPESPRTQMRVGLGVPGNGAVTKKWFSFDPANMATLLPIE